MDNDLENLARRHSAPVRAGLPGRADGQHGRSQPLALDPYRLLGRQQPGGDTCLLRISGHLWADQGICDGDIAVIDRAAHPRTTDLVVGGQATTFNLYRFTHHANRERPWGVVIAVIRPFSRRSLGRTDANTSNGEE